MDPEPSPSRTERMLMPDVRINLATAQAWSDDGGASAATVGFDADDGGELAVGRALVFDRPGRLTDWLDQSTSRPAHLRTRMVPVERWPRIGRKSEGRSP